MSTNFDFGGIAKLVEYLDGKEQPELQAQLIEVARVWAHRVLNPVSDSYGWQSFSELLTELGYTDLGGGFGAWGLPSLDSDYWTAQETLENRIAKYHTIRHQGGPKAAQVAQVVQHPASQPEPEEDFPQPSGGWGTQPPAQWGGNPQMGAPPQQGWGQQTAPQQWGGQQGGGNQCRKCGSGLTQKNVKKQGPNFGRPYLGCTNFACNAFHSWAS